MRTGAIRNMEKQVVSPCGTDAQFVIFPSTATGEDFQSLPTAVALEAPLFGNIPRSPTGALRPLATPPMASIQLNRPFASSLDCIFIDFIGSDEGIDRLHGGFDERSGTDRLLFSLAEDFERSLALARFSKTTLDILHRSTIRFESNFDAAQTEIRSLFLNSHIRHWVVKFRSQYWQSAAPPAIVPKSILFISITL
jgi:hypothetical protein